VVLAAGELLILIENDATFSPLGLCHRAKAPDAHDFRAQSLFGRKRRRDDFVIARKLLITL
jgi:hypothetical protein